MKAPKIFVVVKNNGDQYHLWSVDLCRWFFDEHDAEQWIEKQVNPNYFSIETVEGGDALDEM
jgi:hypothetical protein